MNSSASLGARPSAMVKPESRLSSIQPKAIWGGPLVEILSPSALTGRMDISVSTTPAALSTPSTAATSATAEVGIVWVAPNSSTGRSSRSTPAVMSSDRSPKLERRPSVSTKAETTNDTARTTAKVVRANRMRLARRFLMVRRNTALLPRSLGPSVAETAHAVQHRVGGRVGQLVDDPAIGQEDDAVGVGGRDGVVGDHDDGLAEVADRPPHEVRGSRCRSGSRDCRSARRRR